MSQPVAITMGDPAGIGSELIYKLVQERTEDNVMIFGDASLFESLSKNTKIKLVDVPCMVPPQPNVIEPRNASAVIQSIELAVQAVQNGEAQALLTAPINKAHLKAGAEFAFPGHTEFLAALDGKERSVMMLSGGGLRVVPVTIHIPLNDVPTNLTPKILLETIEITAQDLRKYLGREPRLVVAGLNPHAGENGYLGSEEVTWIAPLIASIGDKFDISGPFPADTLFHEKARARYDVAICMYHDQALIPVKTLAFDEGVNVTLGLSFLRTSPDHGTAYDIAGKDVANPKSFIAAYDLAKQWSV